MSFPVKSTVLAMSLAATAAFSSHADGYPAAGKTITIIVPFTAGGPTDKVARDFPELTLIMSHGGYPFVNEAVYTCLRNANVYMDISEYERAPMVDV